MVQVLTIPPLKSARNLAAVTVWVSPRQARFMRARSPGFTPQLGQRRDSAALRIALLIGGLNVVMLNDESRLGRYREFLPLRKDGTLQPRCCLL